MEEFRMFEKIPRLTRECVVTEKIDGTNAQIFIGEDGEFLTGSRKRWITPENDNYGFSRWAHEHKDELMQLGPGRHFGEWWGQGIQRKYGLDEKRFSLFNVGRWTDSGEEGKRQVPECCHVVPILYKGMFDSVLTVVIDYIMAKLENEGSYASPGFMDPEGIIIFHKDSGYMFKKTIKNDSEPKGKR